MKSIQEKLEAISLNLDTIISKLHGIIKEKQKYYYSKLLKLQRSKRKDYSEKLKNMSSMIEHLQDLEHIIKIGKSIVNLILLENMPKTT